MYVISLDHYLNDKGAIAIKRGPARKLADFATSAVAYASNPHRLPSAQPPTCFKCRKPTKSEVDVRQLSDGRVIWRCSACDCQGQISNWQGTFWDLSSAILNR